MAAIEAQKVCCANMAGFVMYFEVGWVDAEGHHRWSHNSPNFPIDKTECIDMANPDYKLAEGTMVCPRVHAVGGIHNDGDKSVVFRKNGAAATYEVKGTTLSYSVHLIG